MLYFVEKRNMGNKFYVLINVRNMGDKFHVLISVMVIILAELPDFDGVTSKEQKKIIHDFNVNLKNSNDDDDNDQN